MAKPKFKIGDVVQAKYHTYPHLIIGRSQLSSDGVYTYDICDVGEIDANVKEDEILHELYPEANK